MKATHPVFVDVQTISTTDAPDDALVPEWGKIICLSYWTTHPRYDHAMDGPRIKSAIDHEGHPLLRDEITMLELFASFVNGVWRDEAGNQHSIRPIIVWNQWAVDTLLVRCVMNDVPLSRKLDLRWWGDDIMPIRAMRNGPKQLTLNDYAHAYGVVGGSFPHYGDRVAHLYKTDPDAVVAYSQDRLYATRELYKLWAKANTFCPRAVADNEFYEPRVFDPAPNPVWSPEGAEEYLLALGHELPQIDEWPGYGSDLRGWRELIGGIIHG